MTEDMNGENQTRREIQRVEDYPATSPMEYDYQQEEPHLRDYLSVLMRRKAIALVFFLVVATSVTVGTFLMQPVYRSTITIKIEKETPNIFQEKSTPLLILLNENDLETQKRILLSRSLAVHAIRSMGLADNPEFTGRKSAQRKAVNAGGEQGIDNGVIASFLSRVTVQPVRDSRLMQVSFDSTSPRLSALVANGIGKAFMELTMKNRFDATQQSREWLEKQMEEMRAKVETAEEALNKYAAEKGIVYVSDGAPEGEKGSKSESFVARNLGEISSQLVQATTERITKEVLYKESLQGNAAPLSVTSTNPVTQELKKKYAELESEYAQLSKIYKPDYPRMVRLKEQMNQLKQFMEEERRGIVASLKKDYTAAVQKEAYLRGTLEKYRKDALTTNDKMVQYNILLRDAQTNRELYNGLLQRLKETGVAASITSSNIQVLDAAEVPGAPYRPDKSKNILLGVIVGLIGGIGLAFFSDYLDNTLKTPSDVEKRVLLPSLGLVPQFKSTVMQNQLITYRDKKSPCSESYRSIGTYIQFSSAGRPPKTMLVTSAREGEGKTSTVVNTAISLTNSIGRGIIIDTDMRKPQIHRIFDLDNSRGLSSYLTGNSELNEGLIQETKVANLDVIPAGIIPPNPSELLSSQRMKGLVESLSESYSFIILDAPPVLGLSDSLILSTITDGVIMVVRAGSTPRDAVIQGRKLLQGVNAKILGVVLNGLRESDMRYGALSYYHSYYYGGGYGNHAARKKRRTGSA